MQKPVKSLTDVPEIATYLARIAAEPRSLRLAVVRELHGKYWRDIARIYFDPTAGSIRVFGDKKFEPTDAESKAIKDALQNYRFPQSKRVMHYQIPAHLQERQDADLLFHFKDRDGALIMLVARYDKRENDSKIYVAWTLFDDDEWRCAEPDGLLPLYNLENLKPEHTTVFIHEGPKKARHVHRLINPHTDEERAAFDAHPWIDDLSLPDVCHLGWHGGALNPYRTDWSVLKRAGVKRVFIVSDNDAPGVEAVPKIASELRDMKVHNVRFGKAFTPSWDMADDLPPNFYETKDNKRRYIGPSFDSLLAPATWATDTFPTGKKTKPIVRLRPEFKDQWMYCLEQKRFVNLDRPTMCYDKDTFDSAVAPFSDTDETSRLVIGEWRCQASRLTYRPDIEARTHSEENHFLAVNTYIAPRINSVAGISQPWEDFLEHLFVREDERNQVKRWCSTLIAHPEIRMTYSLLLVSERQGVGKTTLGEQVLAPLVGLHNVSFPSENMIVDSPFNAWVAEKRLVIVGEIYAGKSWKAYQKLKGYITDKNIEVHKKFMNGYNVQNWAHFVCSSNSMRALKIEDSDRRWYIPEVTENLWGANIDESKARFKEFRHWLRAENGLGVIKRWAEQYGDYIEEGEHSPITTRKEEMITESMPEPIKMLYAWCEAHCDVEMIVSDRSIKKWLQDEKQDPQHQTPLELRKAMGRYGWKNPGIQIKLDGYLQYTMMSPKLTPRWEGLNGASIKEKRDWIRDRVKPMVSAEERSI